MSALVVNMFAGPGAGKSSMRAGVFAELKWMGIECEEALEFAKDLTWEQRIEVLQGNQDYIFGKQLHRIQRLADKVDVIVCDSPLMLSVVYDKEKDEDFHRHVFRKFSMFRNLNFFVKRVKPYKLNGRNETEEEAIAKDREVKDVLNRFQIPYIEVPGEKGSVPYVVDLIVNTLNGSYRYDSNRGVA